MDWFFLLSVSVLMQKTRLFVVDQGWNKTEHGTESLLYVRERYDGVKEA